MIHSERLLVTSCRQVWPAAGRSKWSMALSLVAGQVTACGCEAYVSQLLYSESWTSQHNRFLEICKWDLREIWFLRSLSFCVFCIRFSSQEICIHDCSLTFLAGCWPPVLLLKYETGVWTKSERFGSGSAHIQIYFNEICLGQTLPVLNNQTIWWRFMYSIHWLLWE